MSKCPYCGDTVVSVRSNFCASCGRQLREIPPEDVPFIAPEDERYDPMQVIGKQDFSEWFISDIEQAIKNRDKEKIKIVLGVLQTYSDALRETLMNEEMSEDEEASAKSRLCMIEVVLKKAKQAGY